MDKIKIDSIVYFTIGRFLMALVCLMMALYCLVCKTELEPTVPTFIGIPGFWLIAVALCWAGCGFSFLFKWLTRLSGTILCVLIMLILATSTYRGFYSGATFIPTVLSFAFYFAFIGGGLMLASRGQWMPSGFKAHQGKSDDLYYAGRILMGIFFFTTGWLHFDNIHGDAQMLSGMPGAVFWVVFVGICWFAVALSFWMNIMARTSALLASLLVLIISFMINLRGLGQGNDFMVWLQFVKNMGVIGGCFLVAYRGHFGLKTSSWWYPPYSWGFTIGKTDSSCESSDF